MNRPLIISDVNKKSQKIKAFIIKKIKNELHLKSNLTIVIGGDGFMLKILKKNKHSGKLFYGINSGNYGFLMNKFSPKKTIRNFSKAKMITISPLEMIVKNKQGLIKKSIAVNEVSILRQSKQAASLTAIDFLIKPCLFFTIISKGEIVIILAFEKFFIVCFGENLFIKKP